MSSKHRRASIGHALRVAALVSASAPSVFLGQSPSTVAGERARLAQMTGAAIARDSAPTRWLQLVAPDVRFTRNSAIPYSLNDGPMWAGRGSNISASAGAALAVRFRGVGLRLSIAPTVVQSQNLPFAFLPGTDTSRSSYSSPFHGPESSIDLPLRFGDQEILRFDPGRSEMAVTWRNVVARLTAANDWWGPAVRNAIVMSSNAGGIPRVELASARPFRTRAGAISVKAIGGVLVESIFFDHVFNNRRSISGAVVTLTPAFDSTLTFGLERVVYTPRATINPLNHLRDVALRWDHNAAPKDTSADGTLQQRSDQITALTAHWIFPSAGLEVYGEWARGDLPRSLTDLLTAAHYTGAYTVGLQWARQQRARDYLRVQTEFTYLEQNLVYPDRPAPEYYSGRGSPQGYTQRGQVIGAAIGPGASSQWLALDYLTPRWQGGVFAGRIRWENDALYRTFVPNFFRHDVTVLGGARGAWRAPFTDLSFDVTYGYRHNFLFQNGLANPGGYKTVDVRNVTVTLAATPR
jgi:hypothetical protein